MPTRKTCQCFQYSSPICVEASIMIIAAINTTASPTPHPCRIFKYRLVASDHQTMVNGAST